MNALVHIPRAEVSIRDATAADIPFIDSLQKIHRNGVGFMARAWIEGKIEKGEIVVAEDASKQPVGYCMGIDRYCKRDDCGIIHQLNVIPGKQRGFVGATLLKAMFDRAAYGCRLFCCWCAQDIEANKFWESMGFVPLAFRAGSDKRARVHIFWQKRIRQDDVTTPWWFPAKTEGGAMREDRLVFPIPPGMHWSDEMPVLRPAEYAQERTAKALPDERESKPRLPKKFFDAPPTNGTKHGPRQFANPPSKSPPAAAPSVPLSSIPTKKIREKKPKMKPDPELVAKARELRDRWLEHVNSGAMPIESMGKYDVTRILLDAPAAPKIRQLSNAA
jgi:N-acetylglutamate synthase-like GNAT family acetyltransferase